MKIKLNLSAGIADMEKRLNEVLERVKKHRVSLIEISYGTKQGEMKKRILNFLMKKNTATSTIGW
jgi:hypothetical protein